jgi:hypothetical protein
MSGFDVERVLDDAVTAFAETVDVKVRQLRRFVPKAKDLTNPALTGGFIEEVVRGFVADWIGHRRLMTGTLYSERDVGQKPMQIDGIVYDPTKGPTVLREGSFGVVHPAFCDGIIEIKMTFKNYTDPKEFPGLTKLEARLDQMHQRYLSHLPSCHVMGVVVADDDPASIEMSNYIDAERKPVPYNAIDTVPLKPIFILFKHKDGEFEPRFKDIENMIRAIYHLRVGQQYV